MPEDSQSKTVQQIAELLAEPFDSSEIRWKPATVRGDRALALAYVTSRAIMDRLDEVVGIDGWEDSYEFQPDGTALCRLRVRIGDVWLTKMDVGGQSEQPDEGDRKKSAISDALKRTAVKFGIGRFLYTLPQQWCDYDPQKKQFKLMPKLPTSISRGTTLPDRTPAPPVTAMSKEDQETLADYIGELEQGVTDADTLAAAYRQWNTLARSPMRTAKWETLKAHARQIGFDWSTKTTTFVPSKRVKEPV